MNPRVIFVMILIWLGVGWGSTQPLGKLATQGGAGPFALIFWQSVICVVVLGVISGIRGRGLVFTRGALTFYGVVAVIGTLIPNTTFYISVTHLPSGIMSIIISTIPLIAFPMALVLRMERFSAQRLMGLGLGGIGAVLHYGSSKIQGTTGLGWGDVKLMAASGLWLSLDQAPLFLIATGMLGILTALIMKRRKVPLGPSLCAALWLCLYWS